MHTVPALLATALILSIIATSLAAFQYWDRNPEKAQRIAGRAVVPIWQGIKLAYRVIRWPVTLVYSWIVVIVMFAVWLPCALSWVLLSKVAGNPARINIKLS